MIRKVAVVGSRGFVGSQIARAIEKSNRYELVEVLRGDCPKAKFADADAIIHAANPAGRYKAEKDPQKDFHETVEKTARILQAAEGKFFILISSLSCRTQLDIAYGRNRRACELIASAAQANTIRLGPMFGSTRTHDVLHDILADRPVYVSDKTCYAYVNVSWVGEEIVRMVGSSFGICEIGASNFVSLGDIARRYVSKSTFSGPDDTQIISGSKDGPDAAAVFEFADVEMARIKDWR